MWENNLTASDYWPSCGANHSVCAMIKLYDKAISIRKFVMLKFALTTECLCSWENKLNYRPCLLAFCTIKAGLIHSAPQRTMVLSSVGVKEDSANTQTACVQIWLIILVDDLPLTNKVMQTEWASIRDLESWRELMNHRRPRWTSGRDALLAFVWHWHTAL